MGMMRLGNKMISTLVKDRVHYPNRLVADVAAMVARFGVLMLVYRYVFAWKGGTVAGLTYDVAAWSMFFYFIFSSLRLRDIFYRIAADVQSGSIEILLAKPVSYLSYRFWWQLGSGFFPFLVMVIIGTAAMTFFIGWPETMDLSLFIPTFFLSLLGSIVLSLVLYAFMAMAAFWVEDANPFFWIADKLVMILGGSYLPVGLFPPFMYKLAVYSPFGASLFITHSPYSSWQHDWPRLIAIQAAWIILLSIALWLIFRRARRKVFVNGG